MENVTNDCYVRHVTINDLKQYVDWMNERSKLKYVVKKPDNKDYQELGFMSIYIEYNGQLLHQATNTPRQLIVGYFARVNEKMGRSEK